MKVRWVSLRLEAFQFRAEKAKRRVAWMNERLDEAMYMRAAWYLDYYVHHGWPRDMMLTLRRCIAI